MNAETFRQGQRVESAEGETICHCQAVLARVPYYYKTQKDHSIPNSACNGDREAWCTSGNIPLRLGETGLLE